MAQKDSKQPNGADEPEEDSLVPVGPGAEQAAADEDDEPLRRAEEESEDGPDEDTERVGHADEEVEAEHKRTSRGEQRRRKKMRAEKELQFLRHRNEQLERERSSQLAQIETRQTQTEIVSIDGRISQVEEQIRQAEEVHAAALDKGSGSDATEALKIRDQLRDGLSQLQGLRNQTVQAARQRAQLPQQQQMDPAIQERARTWASENSDWFDPQLADEASTIAFAVEQRMFREGRLDPRTDAYYAELDRRLKKRLPEVFSDDRDDERETPTRRENGSNRRPTGPTFKTGGRERVLRKGEVFVDADRRQAMEEMGVWDDPVLRERYLKSYQKYDRDNGRRRQ